VQVWLLDGVDDPVEEDPVEEDPVEEDPVEEDPVEDDPVVAVVSMARVVDGLVVLAVAAETPRPRPRPRVVAAIPAATAGRFSFIVLSSCYCWGPGAAPLPDS
jgi:hypothetical protein